jgi:hypothetical protein
MLALWHFIRLPGSSSSLATKLLGANNFKTGIAFRAVGFARGHGSLTDADRVFTNIYGR